jgi:hypothetical protein
VNRGFCWIFVEWVFVGVVGCGFRVGVGGRGCW